MPPWPPDTTYSRFLHERIITQTEKADILSWIATGAVKGDTTLAPQAPTYTKHKLKGTPDLILKVPAFASNATASPPFSLLLDSAALYSVLVLSSLLAGCSQHELRQGHSD